MTCDRIGKLIGGCNFEPRYNTTPPGQEIFNGIRIGVGAVSQFLEGMTKRVYVCDVCTRCGKRVEKQ